MKPIDSKHLRQVIRYGLIKIGIKCDIDAFNYLCYAAELVVTSPELANSLCTIYQKVSKHFSTKNPSCVERSIRHAIDIVANTKGFDALNTIFGTKIYKEYEKPTSGELINLLAEYYNLELYKKDNMFD